MISLLFFFFKCRCLKPLTKQNFCFCKTQFIFSIVLLLTKCELEYKFLYFTMTLKAGKKYVHDQLKSLWFGPYLSTFTVTETYLMDGWIQCAPGFLNHMGCFVFPSWVGSSATFTTSSSTFLSPAVADCFQSCLSPVTLIFVGMVAN